MTLVSLCMGTIAETRVCRTFFCFFLPLMPPWRATPLTLTQILADPQIGGAHYLFHYLFLKVPRSMQMQTEMSPPERLLLHGTLSLPGVSLGAGQLFAISPPLLRAHDKVAHGLQSNISSCVAAMLWLEGQ